MATTTEDRLVDDLPDGYHHWFWRLARGSIWMVVESVEAAYINVRFYYGVWSNRARMRVRRYRAERRFAEGDRPDPDEIPGKKWSPVRFTCADCRRSWRTPQGINEHYRRVHGPSPRVGDPDNAAGTPVFGRRPHGKARTRGRRRPPTAAVDRRTAWTRIGVKAMEDGLAAKLKSVWQEIGQVKPRKLSQIRSDLLALEQVHGVVASEAVDAYRMHLIRLGFDPALLQNLTRARAALEEAAKFFTATVAVIEAELAEDIALAKAQVNGSRPSAETLAR
ncbi:MAG: hypothetical protein HOY78_02520 [Saccharothrix sp.]|nr:hypothetical protein [Saccharothrix sp.]